jgi:uncharacterized protein YqjF (DUF2071 family)
MRMRWLDLLFMHWPIEPGALQRLLPRGLEIDAWEGQAWLGVIPFEMADVRPRGLPGFPGHSRFPEFNVRTYVRAGGMAGVWFFSLDAASGLAVQTARRTFRLNYLKADMSVERRADGSIEYRSKRTHRDQPGAELHCECKPTGEAEAVPATGTFEAFLVSRYRLFSGGFGRKAAGVLDHRDADAADGQTASGLLRGEIDHPAWELQPAEVEIHRNSMAEWIGVKLDGPPPVVHFARGVDVRAWRPRRVTADECGDG